MEEKKEIITSESNLPTMPSIENMIHVIRGQQVMLDRDLAKLYEVETRTLNQQVKRNIDRFPEDFMFQLSHKEFSNLKSQNVISSWGGMRQAGIEISEGFPELGTDSGVRYLRGGGAFRR